MSSACCELVFCMYLAPKITQQPGPSVIYCPLGKKVTLSCRADGKPVPQLQWYCGEYAIEGATAYEVDVDTPGNYFCVATNRVDSATSISVAIAIVKSEGKSLTASCCSMHYFLFLLCLSKSAIQVSLYLMLVR